MLRLGARIRERELKGEVHCCGNEVGEGLYVSHEADELMRLMLDEVV